MTRKSLIAFAALAVCTQPLHAADLSVAKSRTIVDDRVNLLNPRVLPGATLDFALLVSNPLANLLSPVRRVVISDIIPPTMKLRLRDIAATGSGPVEFADGDLLNLGLLGSGLSYRYTTLADATDGLEFFDGTSWGYVPVPDAEGFDARVRGVRVTLGGTCVAGAAFRLRYRVAVR